MRNQSHRSGFAIGTRHSDQGYTAVATVTKHKLNDGLTYSATLAKRRRNVHAQAWCSIHFHHATASRFKGVVNTIRDDITPHTSRPTILALYRTGSHLGVHIVSDISSSTASGQIGIRRK